MKKRITFFLANVILALFNSFGQEVIQGNDNTGNFYYQSIKEFSKLDSAQIYENTISFISEFFKSTKSVIDINTANKIVIQGNTLVYDTITVFKYSKLSNNDIAVNHIYMMGFEMTFDIKHNKARCTITNPQSYINPSVGSLSGVDQDMGKLINWYAGKTKINLNEIYPLHQDQADVTLSSEYLRNYYKKEKMNIDDEMNRMLNSAKRIELIYHKVSKEVILSYFDYLEKGSDVFTSDW